MTDKEIDELLKKVLTIPLTTHVNNNSLITYGKAIEALKVLYKKLSKNEL